MAKKKINEFDTPTTAVTTEFLLASMQIEGGIYKTVKITIGDVLALAGGVTGSGNVGYLPKISTAPGGTIATLSNSAYQDTGSYATILKTDDSMSGQFTVSATNIDATVVDGFINSRLTVSKNAITVVSAGIAYNRVAIYDVDDFGYPKLSASSITPAELGALSGIGGNLNTILTALDNNFDNYQPTFERDQPSGYAGLDSSGKINPSQLPAIAITDTFVVASQVAMLALTAQTGDIAVRTDLNETFILRGSSASVLANWEQLLTPTSAVSSVFGRTGAITAQSGDYTTTQVTEGTNLYYTDSRARAAITGTTNRITVTAGVIDISSSYVGQTSITTLGTIATGVWNGTAVADTYISSASTWNAKESALTFSTGLTRTTNTITNNLSTGVSGGQTLTFASAATSADVGIFKRTSANALANLVTNAFAWTGGNNGSYEYMRMGELSAGFTNVWFGGGGSYTASNYSIQYGSAAGLYLNAASGLDLRLNVGGAVQVNLNGNSVGIYKPMFLTANAGSTLNVSAGTLTAAPIAFAAASILRTTATQFNMEVSSEGQLFYTPNATRNFVAMWGYVSKTANYTATVTDQTIHCTANSFTVTLPTAAASVTGVPAGRVYIVKNSDAGATITVNTTSSQTIDGSSTATITGVGVLKFQSTGTNWILI